jgi:sigma-70-like protein
MAASPVDDAYLESLRHPRELESAVDRARRKLTVLPDGRTRARTIPPAPLTRDERLKGEETSYPDVDRPRTRGDCSGQPRPCPWISCSHHLYLDANPKTGAIKLNFPALEVWEMTESCSLDVADRGGITLEDVGRIFNLTRERIRQVEVMGLERIRDDDTGGELGVPPERTVYAPPGKPPHGGCP